MYAGCELTERARVSPSGIETTDLAVMTDQWLRKPWQQVRKRYENLASKQANKDGAEVDYDKVAKGPDLLKSIERDLRARFSKKRVENAVES
jgi:hypothetical protein